MLSVFVFVVVVWFALFLFWFVCLLTVFFFFWLGEHSRGEGKIQGDQEVSRIRVQDVKLNESIKKLNLKRRRKRRRKKQVE